MEAAELIAGLAPADLNSVFFVNSGSEAVESAIKLARQFHLNRGKPNRTKIIARDMAYHGTTLGALAVTGIDRYRAPYVPVMPGVRHFPNTLGEVVPEGGSAADLPSLRRLEEIIEEEGSETIAAVFAEPVQNSRGALVPPPGYWPRLREICSRHGILLVADEVITAFGRIGGWFTSVDFGATPDLITFAKGATSGYAPLGGVVISDEISKTILSTGSGSFMHGATWGGHPVSTAIATANISALRDENVPARVHGHEARLQAGLDRIREEHYSIKEWRGSGFFYALEFTGDRDSERGLTDRESIEILRRVMPQALSEVRLITRPDDRGATMLTIAPPLVADAAVLDELLNGVEHVADAVDSFLARR